jgi:hypothetical protein
MEIHTQLLVIDIVVSFILIGLHIQEIRIKNKDE